MSSNAGEAATALRQMAQQFPQYIRPALATLGRSIKSNTRKQIEKGADPLNFKPLSKVTLALRRIRGTRSRKFGGKLSKSIKVWAATDSVRVGWPEGLKKHGQSFQSSESGRYDKKQRAYLYRRLLGGTQFVKGQTTAQRLIDDALVAIGQRKRKKSRRKNPPVELQYYSRPARPVWSIIKGNGKVSSEAVRVVGGAIRALSEKAAAKAQAARMGLVVR